MYYKNTNKRKFVAKRPQLNSVPANNKFYPNLPFDLFSIDELCFPKAVQTDNDSIMLHTNLLNSLYRKNTKLIPTSIETFSLNEIVTKVMSMLNRMINTPHEFRAFQIREVIQVGSFKNGTMRSGKNIADIVVMVNTVPTKILIKEISIRILSLLNETQQVQIIPKSEKIDVKVTDKGFDIYNGAAQVSILIAAYPEYIKYIADEDLRTKVEINLLAVRHSKFLEGNSNPFTKILSRVLRFIVQRNEKLFMINPWMIDSLSCYVIFSNYSNQPLILNQAFLRAFQLLSAGVFSPNHGISDPCTNFNSLINDHLSMEQQEVICETAQKLLNKILAGKVDEILELNDQN